RSPPSWTSQTSQTFLLPSPADLLLTDSGSDRDCLGHLGRLGLMATLWHPYGECVEQMERHSTHSIHSTPRGLRLVPRFRRSQSLEGSHGPSDGVLERDRLPGCHLSLPVDAGCQTECPLQRIGEFVDHLAQLVVRYAHDCTCPPGAAVP